jgi:membrane fusion protein (multidrug efflux system)
VETAHAQIQAANATIQAAKAGVDTAQLNLGFTRLTSPIDGIAGIAQQQVGALVNAASGAVTTVSTVNPIKCYFTVSEQEYLSFHRKYATQASLDAQRKQMRLELVLSDGTVYQHPGSIFFADRQVNEGTGAIRIAGLFPNPNNALRPGQYGRIRTSIGTQEGALLVPQRSVSELQGNSLVAVVEAGNKIAIRPVKPGVRSGNMWVIDQGLKPGEMVVVEGVQKVRPGMEVNVKSYNPPTVAAGR